MDDNTHEQGARAQSKMDSPEQGNSTLRRPNSESNPSFLAFLIPCSHVIPSKCSFLSSSQLFTLLGCCDHKAKRSANSHRTTEGVARLRHIIVV